MCGDNQQSLPLLLICFFKAKLRGVGTQGKKKRLELTVAKKGFLGKVSLAERVDFG